jgi:hypothetical protein
MRTMFKYKILLKVDKILIFNGVLDVILTNLSVIYSARV